MTKKSTTAQLQALDRVLYLLEEQSFQSLGMKDETFASFIETLYKRVDQQANQLQAQTM